MPECYIEDGVVVCIACFTECFLFGKPLIGLAEDELISLLGQPDEIGESLWVSEERLQTPYEYFSFGIQIWFENEKTVSAFCNAED
ncbi:hypothetical protein [Chitiniphilus eburneus]|uniref:Uncharacterized protein n=1 Tax=Chitiniphilus eburneus TaxID=2571148 RepID=A0A4U0Q600_9NEIS|nr:hypothetical protein [Chitiniphilus eburneus]TJZ76200.1 hypothetical protein FAZ21_05335 [Chitiniphilus eburneus]